MDNATTDKYFTKVSRYLNQRLSNSFPLFPFGPVFRGLKGKTGKKWVDQIVLYFKICEHYKKTKHAKFSEKRAFLTP